MADHLFYTYQHPTAPEGKSTKINDYLSVDNRNIYNDGTIPQQLLGSYYDSLIFDVKRRTIWHEGWPFGHSAWGSTYSEIFNDFDNNDVSGFYNHGEGSAIKVEGFMNHAENYKNIITGCFNHGEGIANEIKNTNIIGSHIEGGNNKLDSKASYSHVEGYKNELNGPYSHIEGSNNTIDSNTECSHAEGHNNIISDANYAHVEGWNTSASGIGAHAEGGKSDEDKLKSEYSGTSLASGDWSHSEGNGTIASGFASHAEGARTQANAHGSHSEGYNTIADGNYSHSEGHESKAGGEASHAEGYKTKTTNNYAHAEGIETTASGEASHAEGYKTIAAGEYSHAEGYSNTTFAQYSHVSGRENIISNKGHYSIANGYKNTISTQYSHVSGASNTVNSNADYSFVSGTANHVNIPYSLVFGSTNTILVDENVPVPSIGRYNTIIGTTNSIKGENSNNFIVGDNLQTSKDYEIAFGKYNITDDKSIFNIGDGKNHSNPHNLFKIDNDGVAYINNRPIVDSITESNNTNTHIWKGNYNDFIELTESGAPIDTIYFIEDYDNEIDYLENTFVTKKEFDELKQVVQQILSEKINY